MTRRATSFAISVAAGAATLTAASAPSPLYPVYQQLWGLSSFTVTLVFAVYVFALLAALLTVGSLSDRVGRRPVASAALGLLAVGMVLFAVADGPGGLIAARIVQGFAVGAATSTTTAMILDSASDGRRGAVASSAAPVLGIVIGALVSGALVEFAPDPRQLVFQVFGAAYLLLAGLVWLTPRGDLSASGGPLWRSLLPRAALPPAVRPVFLALLPAMVAVWALSGLYLSLGSSVLEAVLGVQSHFVVGIVLAVFFGVGTVGAVVAPSLPAASREWIGYGSLGGGVAITVAATGLESVVLYVVGSAIAGFGFGAAFQYVVASLGAASPPDRRGEVFATMYIASYLAFSVPALIAGVVVGLVGLEATAIGYGVLVFALVIVALGVGLARSRAAGRSPQEA